MKGEACGFLHQYDKTRMPICRFFRLYGECREQDCVYKHTNEDIKECNMYVKLGFLFYCLIKLYGDYAYVCDLALSIRKLYLYVITVIVM